MKRTIIINEHMANAIKDAMNMTQFKFNSNIKRFLADLLEDPVNCQPDPIFAMNGIDKNKLIKSLSDGKVIVKKMNINDHDADGNPHTAMMTVKYSVPKERFQEKLDALYDTLFPDVEAKINEEGGAGGGATSCSGVDGNGFGSGEFIQPLFGVQKKKKYSQTIKEGMTGIDDDNRGAAGYIYCQDVDGQWCILAGKRITNDDSNSLMNPPMGHLHVKEDPHDGVARECREETDLNIPKNRFIQKDVEEYAKDHFTYHFVAVLYGDTTEQHEPGDGDGENEHFKWIPVSEIGNYEWAWSCGKFAKKFSPKN